MATHTSNTPMSSSVYLLRFYIFHWSSCSTLGLCCFSRKTSGRLKPGGIQMKRPQQTTPYWRTFNLTEILLTSYFYNVCCLSLHGGQYLQTWSMSMQGSLVCWTHWHLKLQQYVYSLMAWQTFLFTYCLANSSGRQWNWLSVRAQAEKSPVGHLHNHKSVTN